MPIPLIQPPHDSSGGGGGGGTPGGPTVQEIDTAGTDAILAAIATAGDFVVRDDEMIARAIEDSNGVLCPMRILYTPDALIGVADEVPTVGMGFALTGTVDYDTTAAGKIAVYTDGSESRVSWAPGFTIAEVEILLTNVDVVSTGSNYTATVFVDDGSNSHRIHLARQTQNSGNLYAESSGTDSTSSITIQGQGGVNIRMHATIDGASSTLRVWVDDVLAATHTGTFSLKTTAFSTSIVTIRAFKEASDETTLSFDGLYMAAVEAAA